MTMSTYERVTKAIEEVHEQLIEIIELYDFQLKEISGVDRPASLRDQWLLTKGRGDEMQKVNKSGDGKMTTQPNQAGRASIDEAVVSDPQAQKLAKGIGVLLQAAFGTAPDEVQKRLTVNRDAKDALKDMYGKIYRELESTISLLYSVEAEIGAGTLDEIMAGQCMLLKEMFGFLEAKFRGQEATPPQDVTKGAGDAGQKVEKRGRKMSSENLSELIDIRDSVQKVAERVSGFASRFEDEPEPKTAAADGSSAGMDAAAIQKAVDAKVAEHIAPVMKQVSNIAEAIKAMAVSGGMPVLPAGNALDNNAADDGADFGGPTRHHGGRGRKMARAAHSFEPR